MLWCYLVMCRAIKVTTLCQYQLGGEVTTLAEALCQRIQWSKNRIHVPPIMRNTNPAPTSGRRGTTSDGSTAAQRQHEKAQQQQQISKTTQQEH
jgi:hypothetical protein